jgi:hypothetical protein
MTSSAWAVRGAGGRTMLTLIPCPECGVTAEVRLRFSLASTEGPVGHIALNCVAGHRFLMPLDGLASGRP